MESIKKAIYLLLVIAIIDGGIFAVFHLFKSSNKVDIPATDQTMVPDYEYGSRFLTPVRGMSDVQVGQAVAYQVPYKPETIRVAWVRALEGQTVSLTGNGWAVDGAQLTKSPQGHRPPFTETVVPNGCVWVLSNVSEEDSAKLGPIPVRCILGRLPPPKL